MRLHRLALVGALSLAADATAAPIFVSMTYTCDIAINGVPRNGALITAQAKGLTENLTQEQATAGRVFVLPVSMNIFVEGLGALDVHQDVRFFVLPDVGFVGFGPAWPNASCLLVAPDVQGYDLTTSLAESPTLGGGGTVGQFLQTSVGLISFGNAGPGTVYTTIVNPAPGGATALAVPATLALARRRRPFGSG